MSSPSPQSSPPTSQPSNSTSPLLASTPSSLPPPNSTAPPVPTSPAPASTQPPYPAAALPHTPTSPPAPETPSSRPAPTKSPLGLPSPPAPTSRSRSSSRPSPGGKSPPVSHSPPSLGSSSSSSDPISTPVIVAIGVSALSVVAVISILCVCGRKWRRRAYAERDYYEGPPLSPPLPPPLPQKDNIYGVPQNWQLTAPPPEDPVVRLPEHPNPPPPFPSHSGRVPSARQPPTLPPPPPMISSSGASGSNYSGPEILLPPPSPSFAHGFSKNTFTFEELAISTDGFSEANLVGQGGFGYVHKGILLNGKEVAIKQLKLGSGQGEREFQAEIEIISRVHHKHLVSLVGYCISGGRKLLVYEFVPNKTLECHLHGKDQPVMDCSTRLKIALGSAKGLAYLHEDCNPKIIHRDIKASNILLDYNFEAKVADFGLAKFASDNNTHVSTRVMGTFGYLAPEYASSGKLTDKSDVFSFGVMLLELITGRPPVGTTLSTDESLVDWARPRVTQAIEDDYYDDLVDRRLRRNYRYNEMKRLITCAAACVRYSARHRPQMSQVVRALEGVVSLVDMNEHSRLYGSSGSSNYNVSLQRLRHMALLNQEYASSEYSAATSEYGQIPSASSEGQHSHEMKMGKMKNIQSFDSRR